MLIDYFAAPSAADAVAAMDASGGPATVYPPAVSCSLFPEVHLRGLLIRLSAHADPDAVIAYLAQRGDSEQSLVGIPSEWTQALASAPIDRFPEVAGDFRQDPENSVQGAPDPLTTDESLADALGQIATLARRAAESGLEIFCWYCV